MWRPRLRRPATPRTRARSAPAWARSRACRNAGPRARAPPREDRGPVWRAGWAPARSRPRTGRLRLGRRRCRASGGPLARLKRVLERVDEGLPRGLDDVLRDADRAPGVASVGGVEEHPGHGPRAVVGVEDPDLVVDQLDLGQVRVELGDRVAERPVEGVHRPVALRGADVALPLDPDLDRRLGLDLAVGALLGDHSKALKPEQRLVLARLAT